MKPNNPSLFSNSPSDPDSDGNSAHSYFTPAFDNAQIVNQFMEGDAVELPTFENISPLSNAVSEAMCQQLICLPHLNSSHAGVPDEILTSNDSPTFPLTSSEWDDSTSDVANHRERPTNVAPDDERSGDGSAQAAVSSVEEEGLWSEIETLRSELAQSQAQVKVLVRERRSLPSASPWQGSIQSPRSADKQLPRNRKVAPFAKAETTTNSDVSQSAAAQATRTASTRTASTRTASAQATRTAGARTASASVFRTVRSATKRRVLSRRIFEPTLQDTTYKVPLRSRSVTSVNRVILSFPHFVMLFLLGTGLAYLVGLAFPTAFSWFALSSMVSGMMRGLGLVVFFSLAIAFVLESR